MADQGQASQLEGAGTATEAARPLMGVVLNAPFATHGIRGSVHGCPDMLPRIPASTREAYLDVLGRELENADDVLCECEVAFLTVSGSAAMLPADGLAQLIRKLRQQYRFSPQAEITLELTPETVCAASLASLNTCEFTRLLLRAGACDDKSLAAVGSPWGADDVAAALRLVSQPPCARPSVEIWYGIPNQTPGTLSSCLDQLTKNSQVKEVVLRQYLPPTGGPVASRPQLLEQYEAVVAFLAGRDFTEYGAGRFSREDGRDRSLLARCADIGWMGFGAGANSFQNGYIYSNTIDIAAYLAANGDYTKTVAAARKLTPNDLALKTLRDRLCLASGVDAATMNRIDREHPDFAAAIRSGISGAYMAQKTDGSIALTTRGSSCFQAIERMLGA